MCLTNTPETPEGASSALPPGRTSNPRPSTERRRLSTQASGGSAVAITGGTSEPGHSPSDRGTTEHSATGGEK
jgi:hypothetical protein